MSFTIIRCVCIYLYDIHITCTHTYYILLRLYRERERTKKAVNFSGFYTLWLRRGPILTATTTYKSNNTIMFETHWTTRLERKKKNTTYCNTPDSFKPFRENIKSIIAHVYVIKRNRSVFVVRYRESRWHFHFPFLLLATNENAFYIK